MNPGNTAPYRIQGVDNVCLRTPGNNIDDSNYFTCNNNDREEAWFYTADKKLISANDGRAACGVASDEGKVQSCAASIGTKWEYYPATRHLKIAGTNYCLYLSKRNDTWDGKNRTDLRIAGCGAVGNTTVSVAPDPDNYGKAQCKRSDQHKFASNFKPKIEPSDQKKYECCMAQKEGTKSEECGYNYCNENGSLTPDCINFLNGTYCNDNPTLLLCKEYAELSAKADYCSVGTRLLDDPECKVTCNTDNEIVRTKCEQTALRLCRENPTIPECACFSKVYNSDGTVNKNDPDYKKFTEGMNPTTIAALGSPECWLQPCAASTLPFSELFRRKKNTTVFSCPLCIQNLNITNSNFDDADIKQACSVTNTPKEEDTTPKKEDTTPKKEDTTPKEEDTTPWYKKKEYIIGIIFFILFCLSFMFGTAAILLS